MPSKVSLLGIFARGVVAASAVGAWVLASAQESAPVQDAPNREIAIITGAKSASPVLEIDSNRPVQTAVLSLQQRFGFVITHEDPSYTNADDFVDAAAFVRRDYDKAIPARSRPLIVPKASKLTLQLPAPQA